MFFYVEHYQQCLEEKKPTAIRYYLEAEVAQQPRARTPGLGSELISPTYWLCDSGQVVHPLCASGFPFNTG